MKLYYSQGACSLAIRIIINEIGLICNYESVDLKTKKTEKGEDFFAINPKGAVPVLELDNGEKLTENQVIQQYLVDNYSANQLCPPVGDFQRYRVLEWSNYVSTEVHKSFANLFNPKISEDLKETLFIPIIKNKFNYINNQLSNRTYLTGNQFTLPDAYLFVTLLWASNMNVNIQDLAKLQSYFMELKNRESIKKSLQEEGLTRS